MIFLLIPLVTALVVVLNWRNSPSSGAKQKRDHASLTLDSIVPVLYNDSGVVVYDGIIKAAESVNVSFPIDGILMPGDFPLEVGKNVRENDILFKLDLRQLFKELSARKKELQALAEGLNQEISTNHSDQKVEWDSFKSNVLPTKRLPSLPSFITKSKNPLILEFIKAYQEVARIEARTKDFYFFAPFSGTVVAVKKKVGEQIRAGESVAQLASFQLYIAKFQVSKEHLGALNMKDEITLSMNKKQLKGRVKKISLSKDGTYASVECSLTESVENSAEKITLQLQRYSECFYIPSHLLRNDSLWITRQGRSMKIHATILHWKNDSVAINELKPGDVVLRKRQKSRAIACF